MAAAPQKQRISQDAALLAVEWKLVFADKLRSAAREMAHDSDTVTVEHYQRALPEAVEALLSNAQIKSTPSNATKNGECPGCGSSILLHGMTSPFIASC